MAKPSEIRNTVLFLTPALALILVFFASPVFVSVIYSFTDKALVGAKANNFSFVGLDNYTFMFADERFGISFLNTLIFLFLSAVIGQQVLGFVIAKLMQTANAIVRRIAGLAVMIGWVTPEVVVSFVFFAFLNVDGSLNNVLGIFGIAPKAWLFEHAMIAIIIANIWRGTAFSMLMYQAALDNVSKSVIEAAKIDGANGFQTLFRVTLPMLRGSIATNTILVTLQTLGLFGLIYALTGGGPGYDTTTLPIYMYNKAFAGFQIGYGTAMAIVLLLFGMLLSVFYTKSISKG